MLPGSDCNHEMAVDRALHPCGFLNHNDPLGIAETVGCARHEPECDDGSVELQPQHAQTREGRYPV